MWDIKALYQSVGRFWGASFHLNHVGYKVVNVDLNKIRFAHFHLNHVGYKVCTDEKIICSDDTFI